MSREEKTVRLKAIDDAEAPSPPVIRLTNRDTMLGEREAMPVRLSPHPTKPQVSRRLTVPSREDVELRTHQPDIGDLIDAATSRINAVEEHWGQAATRHQPLPWGWFALIGLVLAAAALWSLSRVEKADERAALIRSATETTIGDEEREKQEAARLITSIETTLTDFADATTVDGLSGLVRHPVRVTPMMRGHYANRPVHCGPLKSIKVLQPVTIGNRGNFWLAAVVLGNDKPASLIVEIPEHGRPLVDWETFVCHQPVEWDDFALQRPAGMALDFRVYAEQDHFFSHEFSDAEKWKCFRLTALDSEETLFGYAPAGGAVERELQEILETDAHGGKASVILRLRVPENAGSRRGVVIERVTCRRWIYLDPPDTAS